MDDFARLLTLGNFPLFVNQTLRTDREEIDGGFAGLVSGAYQNNGVVFACIVARMLIFRQARFQFQQMRGGQPGDLFGTPDLAILETPEPSMTTGDLMARALVDADLAGNWFAVRRPDRIRRLRPDWMTIVLGSPNRDVTLPAYDIDTEVIGYVYRPGGPNSDQDPEVLLRTEVAHFAPIPDPLYQYRGMSWLTPIIREITADTAATRHKGAFYENAATPNLVVRFAPETTKAMAREFIELFEQDHSGAFNAYRTLFLLGGADVQAVGRDFQQMDFKAVQGAGETRIAQAARVPAVIAGVSEGLAGSSLNAGNYNSAKRQFADGTIRPLWADFAGSVQTIVPPPPGSRLWFDDQHIPFLRDDLKDEAEVLASHAQAIRTLSDGGYVPASVIDAVVSGDLRRLQHSGFLSVQMQPTTPPSNGNGLSDGAALLEAPKWRAVRCPNPSCGKSLGEAIGSYRTTCPRCHSEVLLAS
jgi:phage portal protein BeeE